MFNPSMEFHAVCLGAPGAGIEQLTPYFEQLEDAEAALSRIARQHPDAEIWTWKSRLSGQEGVQ